MFRPFSCTFMYFFHEVFVNSHALIGNNRNKSYFKRKKLYSKRLFKKMQQELFQKNNLYSKIPDWWLTKTSSLPNLVLILSSSFFPIKILLETHKRSGIWFNLMLKTFARKTQICNVWKEICKSVWTFDDHFLVNSHCPKSSGEIKYEMWLSVFGLYNKLWSEVCFKSTVRLAELNI